MSGGRGCSTNPHGWKSAGSQVEHTSECGYRPKQARGSNMNNRENRCKTAPPNAARGRTMRVALLSACCALALAQVGYAQDGSAPAEGERSATELDAIVVLGDRSVTATKTETPILRIPQTIEIVTIEEMQDRGAQN